jgi:hypothetical protein
MTHLKELLTELKQVCESVRMDLQNWSGLSEVGKERVLLALSKFEKASEEDIAAFGEEKPDAVAEIVKVRTTHAQELRSMYDSGLRALHDMEQLIILEQADPISFSTILVMRLVPLTEKDPKVLPN